MFFGLVCICSKDYTFLVQGNIWLYIPSLGTDVTAKIFPILKRFPYIWMKILKLDESVLIFHPSSNNMDVMKNENRIPSYVTRIPSSFPKFPRMFSTEDSHLSRPPASRMTPWVHRVLFWDAVSNYCADLLLSGILRSHPSLSPTHSHQSSPKLFSSGSLQLS